jgi:hypothetical protein
LAEYDLIEHGPGTSTTGGMMILCPIAAAIGCRKCVVVHVCPLKSIIGDFKPDPPAAKQAGGIAAMRKPAPRNRKGARARRPRK